MGIPAVHRRRAWLGYRRPVQFDLTSAATSPPKSLSGRSMPSPSA
jgi:hypothetical protein